MLLICVFFITLGIIVHTHFMCSKATTMTVSKFIESRTTRQLTALTAVLILLKKYETNAKRN